MKKGNIVKVITVIALILILGVVIYVGKNNEKNNNSSIADKNISTNNLSNSDLEELERFYLPIYIASNNKGMETAIANSCISEFNLDELSNSEYKISDPDTAKIYSKDSMDTIIKELLGEKADKTLSELEVDKDSNIYIFRGNDSYIPYITNIKDKTYQENGNIVLDVEYFEFNDGEYFDYYDQYSNNTSNTSDISEEELTNEIYQSYIESRERKNAKITISVNSDYNYLQYKLVSID